MEKKIEEIEEIIQLLKGMCLGVMDRLRDHEALQAQKETAIYNHIEEVKRLIKK